MIPNKLLQQSKDLETHKADQKIRVAEAEVKAKEATIERLVNEKLPEMVKAEVARQLQSQSK